MTAQPVEADLLERGAEPARQVEVPARPRLRLLPAPVNEPPLPALAVVTAGAAPVAVVAPHTVGVPAPEPAVQPVPGTVREPTGRPRTAPAPTTASAPAATAPPRAQRRPVPHRAALPTPLVVPDDEDGRTRAERATPTVDLPDPGRWAGQFVQAATEVAVGLRPAVQLVRWTNEDVYNRLARRGEVATRARRAGRLGSAQGPAGRPRVRSVRTCELRDGIVEASAVVGDAERTRAVALRLEGLDGRWRVTVLELG